MLTTGEDFKITPSNLELGSIVVGYKTGEIVVVNFDNVKTFMTDFVNIYNSNRKERLELLLNSFKKHNISFYAPVTLESLLTQEFDDVQWDEELERIKTFGGADNVSRFSIMVPYNTNKVLSVDFTQPSEEHLKMVYGL